MYIFQWIIGCHVIFCHFTWDSAIRGKHEGNIDEITTFLFLFASTLTRFLSIGNEVEKLRIFSIRYSSIWSSKTWCVSFMKSSQSERIRELENYGRYRLDVEHFEIQTKVDCKNWSIFTSVKQHWNHSIPSSTSISQLEKPFEYVLFIYFPMLLLCRSGCSISTCAVYSNSHEHTKCEHRPQNLIRFIQFIQSNNLHRSDSIALGTGVFSIFIVWHTSILIIHLFYGWHGEKQSMERIEAMHTRQWEMKSTSNLFSCFMISCAQLFIFGNDKR